MLLDQCASPETLLARRLVDQFFVKILLDQDDEVAPIVQTDRIEDAETSLGQGTRSVGLAGDGEENHRVVGEVLGLLDGTFGLPVIDLGVEEGDVFRLVTLYEGSAPLALAASAE